jgi:hypothetical protein
MPLTQWGPWTPDVTDYEGAGVHSISNVVPRGDGYGPFPSFSPYTLALPAPCRGGFYALKFDGTVVTFAGTATKLYQLDNTNYDWIDVSQGGGPYSALSSNANWSFAQAGNLVFATQANVPLQVFDLTASTAFSNALGSPPQAAYISAVGHFLVLSGLLSTPYRIQWSGLDSYNAANSWTSGINSSDFQDFPDGGTVRGIAGSEQSGVIFQDQAIRRMSYVAGSPIIFQIDRIAKDKGLYAPYSIITAGERIFFFANQGFHKIEPGGVPEQIGRERVDRTFLANLDNGNLQLFIGASDPRTSRVYWAYKSISGVAASFDSVIGYDYVLDRFFPLSIAGQYLLGISQTGLTLENLDAIAPGALSVLGTANNGAGLIRISVASTATLTSGHDYAIDNVGGTVEANGNWQINVVSATAFDLIVNNDTGAPSAYVNAFTSGGCVGGSIDAMTLSLDSYATAVQPQIAAFNSAGVLGFFTGPNMQGILEGAEQGTDASRITLRGFRPITDAATLYGSVSYRDTQAVQSIVSAEVGVSTRTGRIDLRRDSRYQRYQMRIPQGVSWTFCAGYEADVTTNGTQ